MQKSWSRKLSINTVLMLVLSAVITVTILLMGKVIAATMEESIRDTSVNYSEQLVSQAKYNLDNYFLGINASLQSLAQTQALVEMFKYSDHKGVGDEPHINLENRKTVNQMILTMTRTNQELSNLIVFNEKLVIFHMDLASTISFNTPLVQEVLRGLDTEKYAKVIYRPIDYPTYYNRRAKSKEIPASLIVRDYYRYDTTNYGVILASFKTKTLDEFFNHMKKENGYVAFILDEDDRIYYSSEENWVGGEYGRYLSEQQVSSKNKESLLNQNGNTVLLEVSRPLELNRWRIVITSDMSSMNAQVSRMKITITASTIAALVIVIILGSLLTRRVTAPLAVMSRQMERMDYQALSQKLNLKYSYKEIDRLYSGYNQMLDRIDTLISEVYYEQLRQKEAQYEALQSKINPHFLYNTLQSISSLAVLERTDDIETVSGAMGGMLEYLTYEKSSSVLLSQELDYIKSYIQIQQLRYSNFTVSYEIIPESLCCVISKLLLQPIVENAINHGFAEQKVGGRLIVRSSLPDDKLILEVADNGVGMDEETAQKLLARINNPKRDSKKKSIGLSNIQERIHLKYGSSYGLAIQSSRGVGTTVKLTIPAILLKPGDDPRDEKSIIG